ncbi:MAG TPA: hypothetical protein VES20_01365 [Bryobacteraceae bacterium]|nr:hypothetical protein [Bryobacteraceae bacterium]
MNGSVTRLEVPVLRLVNRRARTSEEQVREFLDDVWGEAVRSFERCGVALRTVERVGDLRSYPSGRPRFDMLERTMVNVVLTDRVPLAWARGRSVAGVATVYEGFHLCVVAMEFAHPNRFPFVVVNTVVHELLHIFLQDIFVHRTHGLRDAVQEASVDWHATRLWLFNDGAGIRDAVRAYLRRLPGERC